MESVNLIERLREIYIDGTIAKNLVEDGKEVPCSRKLQGLLFKLGMLLQDVGGSKQDPPKKEDVNVVQEGT